MRDCKPHTNALHAARSRAAGLARTAVLLATCLVSGCSLAYVRPDVRASRPADAQDGAPARLCTESMWLPALDLIGVDAPEQM